MRNTVGTPNLTHPYLPQAFNGTLSKQGVDHAQPSAPMGVMRHKIAGERLDQQGFHAIVQDITESRYSKTEISAFLVASG